MPIKKLERESVTVATVVPRSAAIDGNPGRYISMEKGPMADKSPRIRMSKKRVVFGGDISAVKLGPDLLLLFNFIFFYMEDKVIIIGAGAAGLMAARELLAAGMATIVLEAAGAPGGRIRTLHGNGFSKPVEAGAEF